LPFAEGFADVVVCKHSMRLLADLPGALTEMRRILKPGGRLYLIDFDGRAPWLPARLLWAWIECTAPAMVRKPFWRSMRGGITAPDMARMIGEAGLAEPVILSRLVNWLIRARKQA